LFKQRTRHRIGFTRKIKVIYHAINVQSRSTDQHWQTAARTDIERRRGCRPARGVAVAMYPDGRKTGAQAADTSAAVEMAAHE